MIQLTDIVFSIKGFYIEKITKATDNQLSKLEAILTDTVCCCDYANIDDLGFLSISWCHLNGCYDKSEKEAVLKAINTVFKISKKSPLP